MTSVEPPISGVKTPPDLWVDHFRAPRGSYFHPRFWEDGIMPLTEFPREHQEHIWRQVQRAEPPRRWIDGEMFKLPSRAWHEWHWKRGLRLRRSPEYVAPNRSRRWIRPSLRAAVYERDGHRCLHCASTERLTLDHIHPYSLGGEDTLENLQTLCRSCNSRKGARV